MATAPPSPGEHDRTWNRRVFVQRKVCPGPFVVPNNRVIRALQARFVEHDRMIETLATCGPNESVDEGILPKRTRGRAHPRPHRLRRDRKTIKRMSAIVEQVARRLVPRKEISQ